MDTFLTPPYEYKSIPIHNKWGQSILPNENGWYRMLIESYLPNKGWNLHNKINKNSIGYAYTKEIIMLVVHQNTIAVLRLLPKYAKLNIINIPLKEFFRRGVDYYTHQFYSFILEQEL